MENRAETRPTIEYLKQQNTKLEQQNAELSAKLKWYEEQFRLAQQKRFGASSEKTYPDQLDLFNEAEAEADPAKEEPQLETVTYKRKKQRGGREAKLTAYASRRWNTDCLPKSRFVHAATVRCMR